MFLAETNNAQLGIESIESNHIDSLATTKKGSYPFYLTHYSITMANED
jgi:hypothetical protein